MKSAANWYDDFFGEEGPCPHSPKRGDGMMSPNECGECGISFIMKVQADARDELRHKLDTLEGVLAGKNCVCMYSK